MKNKWRRGWRVSLLDDEEDEVLTLSAECGGAPCRVLEESQGVVRLLAPRSGELRLRLDNATALHTLYLEVKRVDGDGLEDPVVNGWNALRPGCGGWLDRDASTGRALALAVAETDEHVAEAPRVRFTVAVMPTHQPGLWRDPGAGSDFWSPSEWAPPADTALLRHPADGKVWVRVTVLPDEETHELAVFPLSTTVAELKEDAWRLRAQGPADSPHAKGDQLFLAAGGAPLDNTRTLAECGVRHQTRLLLLPVPPNDARAMPVRVLFADASEAERSSVEVHEWISRLPASATVADLRLQLADKFNMKVDRLSLRLPGLHGRARDEYCIYYLLGMVDGAVRATGPSDAFVADKFRVKVSLTTPTSWRPIVRKISPLKRVGDLKCRLREKEGVPEAFQRISINGEPLASEDDIHRLANYGIVNDRSAVKVRLDLRCPCAGGACAHAQQLPLAGEVVLASVAEDIAGRAGARSSGVELRVLREEAAPTLTLEVAVQAP